MALVAAAVVGLATAALPGVAEGSHFRSEATSQAVSVFGGGTDILSTVTTTATSTGTDVTMDGGPNLALAGNAIPTGALLDGVSSLPLSTGALVQTATAKADGSAVAFASVASSQLNLAEVVGAQLSGALANLSLNIGAVEAGAIQDSTGANQRPDPAVGPRGYNVASLDINLDIPVLANLLTTLTTQLNTAQAAFQAAVQPILNALNALGGTLCTITPVYPQLGALVTSLGHITVDGNNDGTASLDVDLASGKLTIRVGELLKEAGQDLNNQPAYTDLLAMVVNGLATKLGNGLQGILTDITTKVEAEVAKFGIKIESGSLVPCPLFPVLNPLLGRALTDLTPITLSAATLQSALAALGIPLSTDALNTALQPLLTALNTGGATLTAGLDPVFKGLNTLLKIEVNLPITKAIDVEHTQLRQGALQIELFNAGTGAIPALPNPLGFAPFQPTGAIIVTLADAGVVTSQPPPPVITSPAAGSTVTDATPTITGTGTAGATVTVTDGGATVCTATVLQDGTWSCDAAAVLANGSHTITATQTLNGATSPVSDPVTFTVNAPSSAPAAPAITSPTDGSTVSDTTPTITGTGTPGATVTVTDEAGNTVCTATVAAGGTWSCDAATAFADGSHTITATQTLNGVTSAPSAPVAFTVTAPSTAPSAPAITSPTDGSTVSDTTPTITGTGTPGASVTVTDGGTPVCTATVQQDGTWSCDATTPLDPGAHTITATQTVGGVSSTPSAPVNFTLATLSRTVAVVPQGGKTTVIGHGYHPGPVALTLHSVPVALTGATADANGDFSQLVTIPSSTALGAHQIEGNDNKGVDLFVDITVVAARAPGGPGAPVITGPADGSALSTNTPTITGTGKAGATVNVMDNGTVICTTTVAADGTWSCTPSSPLSGCAHTFTATQTLNGVTSPASVPVSVTLADQCAEGTSAITIPSGGGRPAAALTPLRTSLAVLAFALWFVVGGVHARRRIRAS